MPALLIYGDADRFVPVVQGRDLSRRIPHATVTEVKGEGHPLILARFAEISTVSKRRPFRASGARCGRDPLPTCSGA